MFDVARHLLLVNCNDGGQADREELVIDETGPLARARRVTGIGPDVLICGAISQPLEAMLVSAGVRVICQTCGPVEEVLQAFLSGQLTAQSFLMPGSCGRRRRFQARHRAGGPNPIPPGGAM